MIYRLTRFMLLLFLSAAPSLAQPPSISITVEKLPEQTLPVKVVSAHVESSQYHYELKTDLADEGNAKAIFTDLLLVLFRNGNVISAQGWRNVAPNQSLNRNVSQLDFQPGDRALLIVIATGTNSQIYTLARGDISESIREFIAGRRLLPIPVNVSKNENGAFALVHCSGYCAMCEAIKSQADLDCGKSGVLATSTKCFESSYLYECIAGKKPPPASVSK
jgi:hypothetical protein